MRGFALPSQNPMILQIRPGNRVDLFAALETENGTESLLVAEQVLVLGQVSPEEPVGLILALTRDQINTILPLMNQIQITLVPYNATMSEQVQNVTQNVMEMNNQNGEEDA
jgi:predicted GNAT family acetyltransferase